MKKTPFGGWEGSFRRIFVDYIHAAWIQDQIKFHENKHKKIKTWNQILGKASNTAFIVAFLSSFVCVLFFFLKGEDSSLLWGRVATFFAMALPAVGAAFAGICSHREYARIEKRSWDMAEALKN